MHNTTSAFFPQQQHRSEGKNAAYTARHPASTSQISSQGAGLLGGAAHGSAVQSSSLAGGRGLRFPSSRRYLWDRTPAGPQVLINTQDHVPHVQVAISAFSAISRAVERQTAAVPLQLGMSVTLTNQVTALVQELDPLVCKAGAGALMQLPCPLLQKGVQQDTTPNLRSALQAQVDQRSSAQVQQLYAISATAVPAAAPGERCCLQLQLLMPSCSFMATPLYAKRLCHVPLAEALLKPGSMAAWQSGYLSMDQARSLLPVEATDPNVYSTPLVGVWVKGPSSVMHPLVAMACLRFAYSSLLADRAVNPGTGAFLLLLCPEGDPVSKCFEVCLSDLHSLQLGSYQYVAALNPGTSVAQYPAGLVKADCHVSESKPEPLPGSRIALAAAAATTSGGSSTCAGDSAAAAAAAAETPTRRAAVYSTALHVPQLGVGYDSPVLGHYSSNSCSSRNGLAVPAARSSAPTGDHSSRYMGQQHAAAADARRSLPLTVESATAAGVHTLPGSSDHCRLSTAAAGVCLAESEDAALPQPRSRVPTGPYSSSPPLQQYKSAAAGGLRSWQQHKQQKQVAPISLGTELEHQQWVNLGERLLAEPSTASKATANAGHTAQEQQEWAKLGEQLLLDPTAAAATQLKESDGASAAAGIDPVDGSKQQQCQQQQAAADEDTPATQNSTMAEQQQLQQQAEGIEADADCAPRLGSPVRPYKQQQQQQPVSRVSGDSDTWMVHEVAPVSPSVRAGLALSNLALLQGLSTGQLQAAIENVTSPTKAPQQLLQQQQQQHDQQFQQQQQQQVTGQQQGPGDAADGSSKTQLQYMDPYTPIRETASPSAALSSTALGHDMFASEGFQPVSAAQYEMQHNAGTTAAATALEAATAAVQRMPPSPYGRNLGVQRYAADAAALCDSSRTSHEYSVAVAGAWSSTCQSGWGAGSPTAAAAAAGPTARNSVGLYSALRSSYPGNPYSPCARRGAVAAAGISESQQLQQRLHMSLDRSAAAVASTAFALDTAGELLHPWNAPESVLAHQQLGSRMLAPAWQDPVAQALQGEVEQLRHELAKLQRQLRMAGMPDVTALALPPLEPEAAAPPAVLAVASSAADQPAGVAALQAPAVAAAAATPAVPPLPADKPAAATAAPELPAPAATGAAVALLAGVAGAVSAAAVHVPSAALLAAATAAGVAADEQAASQSVAAAAALKAAGSTAPAATPDQPRLAAVQVAVTAAVQPVGADAATTGGSSCNEAEETSSRSNSSGSCPGSSSRQLTGSALVVADDGGTRTDLHRAADGEAESPTASKFFSAVNPKPPAARSNSSFVSEKASTASPARVAAIPAAVETSSPDQYGKSSRSGAAAVGRQSGAAGSLRGSGGHYVRTSLDVPPLVEVVRTMYCQLSDDSDDSDHEFEEKLMLKYGLKQL